MPNLFSGMYPFPVFESLYLLEQQSLRLIREAGCDGMIDGPCRVCMIFDKIVVKSWKIIAFAVVDSGNILFVVSLVSFLVGGVPVERLSTE
jgi:hypothetical protein